MTDERNLPALAGEIEQVPIQPPSGLQALRTAITTLEDQARSIAEAGDVRTLAAGYADLLLIAKDLRTLNGVVEQLLIETMPESINEKTGKTYHDPLVMDGVGTFEVKRRGATYKWDSDELLAKIVRDAIVDRETGEVPDEDTLAAVDRVVDAVRSAAPFTPSMGWRTTVLAEMGVDVDEYRESKRSEGHSIKFTGGEK